MWAFILPELLKAIEAEPENEVLAELLASLARCYIFARSETLIDWILRPQFDVSRTCFAGALSCWEQVALESLAWRRQLNFWTKLLTNIMSGGVPLKLVASIKLL